MRNCLKIFLLVFTSFMIQFFWQYSFFVNILFVYSDKLQFWKKCHLVSMATRLFTRRFGAEKCLETCWKCSQRSFLAEAHTLGDWYPSASFSSTLSKQWGLLQRWAVWIFTSDTSFRTKMPKFSSQRRKKRKFHGNRFTSKQRVQDEEIVALESTSSGSGASSLHCQK